MPNLKPEDIAAGAKAFLDTEFGQWYVKELKRRRDDHLDLARNTDAHNLTVNQVHKASGNQEAIDLIKQNADVSESSLFKT